MPMKTIRLDLGRTSQWPDGNPNCGYEFKAPLDDASHIAVEEWRTNRDKCIVRRFWQGEEDQKGHLIHTRHRTWAFSYLPGEDDDTPFFRFESHAFVPGEYVSIDEHDGETYTFKVASVS